MIIMSGMREAEIVMSGVKVAVITKSPTNRTAITLSDMSTFKRKVSVPLEDNERKVIRTRERDDYYTV